MRYAALLVLGATATVLALAAWQSRLAGEFIQAAMSRGEEPRYRHHIRWRR